MKQIPIGIDIGASEVKFAVCERDFIRRLVTEPVPEDLVRDGKIVSAAAMASFLKQTAAKYKISGRRCAIVIPDSLSFTRKLIMPAMTAEQLSINLPYEFRDYLGQDKNKYVYDYTVIGMSSDEEGKPLQMELMAAAAEKSVINEYKQMLLQAGFKLVLAAPEKFAYSALIRNYERKYPENKGRENCIIDLGHSAIRVHIYMGAVYEATRVIDIGGAAIDAAIADAMNVDEHMARVYKLSNFNNCLDMEVCKAVYRNIAVEIMRAINFYDYNNPGSKLEMAYLCGGGTRNRQFLKQIKEYVKLELRLIENIMPAAPDLNELAALCPAAVGITQQ